MALNIYLKFGSKGENVKKVQVALGLKASGIYDKQTENAVKTFQKEKGLNVDGIVGPKTWSVLGLDKQNTTVSTATINDNVKTKITANYRTDASGYPVIGATATKTYGGSLKVFESGNISLTNSDTEYIKSQTSYVFFLLAESISIYETNTLKKPATYIIQNFNFVYPTGINIPSPIESINALEKIRQEQEAKANSLELQTNFFEVQAPIIKKATPKDLQPKGSQKIFSIILKYVKQVALLILPSAINLSKQVIDSNLDDICPPEQTLLNFLDQRNKLVIQLNQIGNKINQIGRTISGINNFLTVALSTIRSIDIASILISTGLKIPPISSFPVPGRVTSFLTDAEKFIRKITFDQKGESKLLKINGILGMSALGLSILGGYILQVAGFLESIDNILAKCLPKEKLTLIPFSNEIKQIIISQTEAEGTFNQTTYQGFVIEIEEVPYTSTVNRRRAIGKNQYGIVLIQTELSFTTNPETLINELKLIIDRDNLKAY